MCRTMSTVIMNSEFRYYTWSMIESLRDFSSCTSLGSYAACFLEQDPIASSMWLLIAVIVYSFVWSVLCNNVSKVDQIWSVTPVMYSWMFWLHYYFNHEGVAHIRLTVVTVMVSVWGARLTYNFWRKGGYGNLITHEEDYRWPILREMMHPAVFFFFNLTFIATYQNVLLYLIALPTYFVMKGPSTTFTVFDLIVSCTFISLLAMETVADEQHFQFQAKKYSFPSTVRKTHPDKDVRDGFFQSGLWKFSRHPNYFAEQMMWVCVYLFSIPTTRNLLHFCSIGCVLLILLFQGSIAFGESITKSKYPSYELYQRKVSRCIPVCW